VVPPTPSAASTKCGSSRPSRSLHAPKESAAAAPGREEVVRGARSLGRNRRTELLVSCRRPETPRSLPSYGALLAEAKSHDDEERTSAIGGLRRLLRRSGEKKNFSSSKGDDDASGRTEDDIIVERRDAAQRKASANAMPMTPSPWSTSRP